MSALTEDYYLKGVAFISFTAGATAWDLAMQWKAQRMKENIITTQGDINGFVAEMGKRLVGKFDVAQFKAGTLEAARLKPNE